MSTLQGQSGASVALAALRAAEACLLARRAAPPDPVGAVAEALRAACDGAAPQGYAAAGARIAAMVARHGEQYAAGQEPAYHNRHHQAEATLAMGWLAREARRAGHLDVRGAGLCVLAMAGHDLLHDGCAPIHPGALEQRSAAAALDLAADLPETDRTEIRRLILLTDVRRPPPQDLRGRLARESDMFGSLTPTLGWQLSRAIATECQRSRIPGGERIATFGGRLLLLRAQPMPTAAFVSLGPPAGCALQIAAMAQAAGAMATAEEGADFLDALPPAEAHRRYEAALAALGLPNLPP